MEEKQEHNGPIFGKRHIQVILCFFASSTGYAMRSAMSVAVVAMTTNSTSSNPDIPTFNWNNTSVILSSFFWGYPWLQVLIGHHGQKYGTKYTFLILFTLSTILFMLIPAAAINFGSIGVIVCRALQGLTQGCLVPAIYIMTGSWIPVDERTRAVSIIFTGYSMGSVLGSLLTGYISSSTMGWPAVFYILGGAGLITVMFWWIFMEKDPSSHPNISAEEQKYIHTSLQKAASEVHATPWKAVFTNIPFYSIFIVYIGMNFAVSLLTEMPTYLNKVWKFETSTTGLLTSLPTVLHSFLNTPCGFLADALLARHFWSVGKLRKIFQFVAHLGMAICTCLYCIIPTDYQVLFVSTMFLYAATASFSVGGAVVNLTDLSPRFCGVMGAFCNASSQLFSSLAPLLVQFLITDQTQNSQWTVIFLVNAGILISSAIIFVLFGSGKRQSFDGPDGPNLINLKIKKRSVISMIA